MEWRSVWGILLFVGMSNEGPRGKPRGISTKAKNADLQSALRRKRPGIRPEKIKRLPQVGDKTIHPGPLVLSEPPMKF